MDQNAKLNLDKLIKEYGSEETTDKIRELKHSKLIRKTKRKSKRKTKRKSKRKTKRKSKRKTKRKR